MKKKYKENELAKAILMVLDEGLTPKQVAAQTGINLRALQRYKSKYVGEKNTPAEPIMSSEVALQGDVPLPGAGVQADLDKTFIARAKFLDSVIETKQIVIDRIQKVAKKSDNLDALQKTIKTLDDLAKEVAPDGDTPAIHAKQVNMFQFFNQQLGNDYEGPELTDADIVKGD